MAAGGLDDFPDLVFFWECLFKVIDNAPLDDLAEGGGIVQVVDPGELHEQEVREGSHFRDGAGSAGLDFMDYSGTYRPVEHDLRQHDGELLESVPLNGGQDDVEDVQFVGIADEFKKPQALFV